MTKYLMRLDDACEKRNVENWDRIEALLDKYNVKPLVAVIPNCKDPDFENYDVDDDFWNKRINSWQAKGWQIALHGYEHVFHKCDNRINLNPINDYSEFVGLNLKEQREKIANGIKIFRKYGIEPEVFVAPAHSFDKNTLEALLTETSIRIISDTIAFDSYYKNGFYYIPQQSGCCRKLPFKTITFCYHPNTMEDKDFLTLTSFLFCHSEKFINMKDTTKKRRFNLFDFALQEIYFKKNIINKYYKI